MPLPPDYAERVYAGVLGKMIGVYLGRPFEGWSHDAIVARFGEVSYYVHDQLNVPLIVTDDDLSGVFTFIRALADYGISKDITPAQIGQTWLNYLIEDQTILWWGGLGNSTEHTAYLRLKAGIEAPRSGSIALNSKVVAEQIGSQIFVDSWAMIAPGDPELAADLARRAASVSHDGEAVYGAQVIAALEAQAFVERDLGRLLDTAVALIPADSVIARLISDLREWHAREPDWYAARRLLDARYGYARYGGNCHIVPNHGLIILALLYGAGDFQQSLMIVNTGGWDTDCNSGNLGCLLGIRNGLAAFAGGPDWRGPVADRLFLPTADGGRSITDAVTETIHLVNFGRSLHGQPPLQPKGGARFHFELPGSVQGFASDGASPSGSVTLENVPGHSLNGSRALAIHWAGLAAGQAGRAETATFVPSRDVAAYFERRGYRLHASPTLYPGQTIQARVEASAANRAPVQANLYLKRYNATDELTLIEGEGAALAAGEAAILTWRVPETHGYPIARVGLQVQGQGGHSGTVYLDYLGWDGAPDLAFIRPAEREHNRLAAQPGPVMWRLAWVDGLDSRERLANLDYWPEAYRLIQNRGRGLLMQGTREWTSYQLTAQMTPHMCQAGGIAVRVQGMTRYYALLLDQHQARIIRAFEGRDTVLAQSDHGWSWGETVTLSLKAEGHRLTASINGVAVMQAEDALYPSGAIALVAEAGRIGCEQVEVRPV